MEPSRLGKVLVGLSETSLGRPFLMQEVDTSVFDPVTALGTLATKHVARAVAICRDLVRSHSPDFAGQAAQRQNDEVLEGLLAEAEAGMRQVDLTRLRLAEGCYGYCERCGEAIEPARLAVLPVAEYCLRCADLAHRRDSAVRALSMA